MKDFWLKHSGRHCTTIGSAAELRPTKGYASWRLGNLLGTAFQDDHRLAVNLGDKAGTLEVVVFDPTSHKTSLVTQLDPWSPQGSTDVHFYVNADETIFLFKYVDNKYKVLIQEYDLNGYEWEQHRPTLPDQISYQAATETSRRIKIATFDEGDILDPTQDDEGGGYLP